MDVLIRLIHIPGVQTFLINESIKLPIATLIHEWAIIYYPKVLLCAMDLKYTETGQIKILEMGTGLHCNAAQKTAELLESLDRASEVLSIPPILLGSTPGVDAITRPEIYASMSDGCCYGSNNW